MGHNPRSFYRKGWEGYSSKIQKYSLVQGNAGFGTTCVKKYIMTEFLDKLFL